MRDSRKHRVFVYGTLRKGQHNHYWLRNTTALGTCATYSGFTLVSVGGFPGAVECGGQRISGEVYEISTHVLSRLDRLEGYPDFFDRKIIDTKFGSCWIYIYQRAHGLEPKVMSGDWLRS